MKPKPNLRPSLNFPNLSFNFHGIRRKLTSMIGLSRTTARRSDIGVTPSRRTHQPLRRSNRMLARSQYARFMLRSISLTSRCQNKQNALRSACVIRNARSVALFRYPADTSCKAKTPNHRKIATKGPVPGEVEAP
jgi:hypothetical protein